MSGGFFLDAAMVAPGNDKLALLASVALMNALLFIRVLLGVWCARPPRANKSET